MNFFTYKTRGKEVAVPINSFLLDYTYADDIVEKYVLNMESSSSALAKVLCWIIYPVFLILTMLSVSEILREVNRLTRFILIALIAVSIMLYVSSILSYNVNLYINYINGLLFATERYVIAEDNITTVYGFKSNVLLK